MKNKETLETRLARVADAIIGQRPALGADTVKQGVGALIEMRALINLAEVISNSTIFRTDITPAQIQLVASFRDAITEAKKSLK